MKEKRWYEILDEVLYIYNNGFKKDASSVSLCKTSDLGYYKKTFRMQKIWGDSV